MYILNPLRPGSVTTDILHNGAVTCVKTDFSACVLPLSDATLSGSLTGGTLKPGTVLAVTYGGTGTATPALVAGTAISITGTWPNQTINNTSAYATLPVPLAVNKGGTGLTAPALVAGTAISITGTWPNQTINNTSAYALLADPLPVLHGGTGTTTPALVAGTNITITGSWPNQTVALNSNIAISFIDLQRTAPSSVLLRAFNPSGTYIGGFSTDGSNNLSLLLYDGTGSVHSTITQAASNLVFTTQPINFTNKFAQYNSITLAGGGVPAIILQGTHAATSGNITLASITAPSTGLYRVSIYIHITSNANTGGQIQATYTDAFVSGSAILVVDSYPNAAATGTISSGVSMFYASSGSIIAVKLNNGDANAHVAIAWTLEAL